MSVALGVHLKTSSMLIGSFGVCMYTEMEKAGFLLYSLWNWVPSHLPKTLFWQALNYLHSSLPKLFKYVRSWSNRKAFEAYGRQSFPPWAVGDQMWKQGKNKGLSGLLKTPGPQQPIKIHSVKQAWNTRRLQEPLKHVRTPLLSLRKCGVRTWRYFYLKHKAFTSLALYLPQT